MSDPPRPGPVSTPESEYWRRDGAQLFIHEDHHGMKFQATIRYWRPEQAGGLAVADVPSELIASLGGLKQMRVRGTINGAEYVSNVMPAGSGRLALSVSKKMMGVAGADVGDEVEFEIERVPPPRGET